ncbi:MAG: hypothetical protein OJJ54_09295 [Pseudonocardia sp.]|nr:hypothetical protein [Pseudonocardia sp.]
MPIRSPRGRSAAYRSVWSWPLRSPLRLAVSALVVIGLVVGVSALATSLRGPQPDPVVTGQPGSRFGPSTSVPRSTASAAPTALPPVAPLTPTTLPVSQAPAQALSVAAAWSRNWATHPDGMTSEQWVAGLRPYTTDEYIGTLTGVDPRNIPASRVTGDPVAVQVSPRSVQVDVPTDALTLRVLVVQSESGGWQVAGYDKA